MYLTPARCGGVAQLFDGLLHEIKTTKPVPHIYKRGQRGPEAADVKTAELGIKRSTDYTWSEVSVRQPNHPTLLSSALPCLASLPCSDPSERGLI